MGGISGLGSSLGASGLGSALGGEVGQDSAALQDFIAKKLEKQASKMNKQFKILMRNKETCIWQTMIEWVQSKLSPVSNMLTR